MRPVAHSYLWVAREASHLRSVIWLQRDIEKGHKTFEHTADIGIEAWGSDLEICFGEAAAAMLEIIFGDDPPARESAGEEEFRLVAQDREDLLVQLLSELNYHCIVTLTHPYAISLQFDASSTAEYHLHCRFRTESLLESFQQPMEIKAVTYHGLELRQEAAGWRARVIFDI